MEKIELYKQLKGRSIIYHTAQLGLYLPKTIASYLSNLLLSHYNIPVILNGRINEFGLEYKIISDDEYKKLTQGITE